MSLRDEVAEIIQTIDEPWLAADDILEIVREALLSDEAVRAGGDAIWRELSDDADPSLYVAERTITAALDAIMKEPK